MAFQVERINPLDLQPRKAVGVGLPFSGLSVNGSQPVFGVWYYFVFEMYIGAVGNGMLDNKMWLNGTQQNLISFGTPSLPNQNFNGGNGSISKYRRLNPVDYNYNGMNDYSMFRVYNRTLSQQEITNNYNYYKPIFNLS